MAASKIALQQKEIHPDQITTHLPVLQLILLFGEFTLHLLEFLAILVNSLRLLIDLLL